MSQMKRPEMTVIRFVENDIVVASSSGRRMMTQSFDLTGCYGRERVRSDGALTYNGVVYSLDSTDNVDSFISALGASGIKNAGIQSGAAQGSLRNTLNYEVSTGAKNYKDGTYVYDPSAIWNNGNQDLYGVFIRQ